MEKCPLIIFKEDFQLGPDGGLCLYDARFLHQKVFVGFEFLNCPECQDTKQRWKAYVVPKHLIHLYPLILLKQKDGKLCTIN